MSVDISIVHNDVRYTAHVATIKSTRLGWQDHGLLTAGLDLQWEGGGVNTGAYALDTPEKDADGKHLGRVGTAYGLDHIMQVMQTVGVESWEALKGKQVYALFPGENSWGSIISGIANLSTGKALIFKEHAEAWREKEA